MRQAAHDVALVMLLKVRIGHGRQELKPVTLLKEPRGHAVQAVLFNASAYVPAGQAVQAVALVLLVKKPRAHCRHEDSDVALEK